MRLNVSAWSIRRPIPAAVAFAVLMILGLISFRTMSVTRFPNIDIPIVQVLITQSGAAPSELESQVTKKVEDAVSSINGVWHIISTATDGSSSTVIQFTVGSVDIDRALNDVKDQIAKIRSDLPRTIDEPIISRVDIEGLPIGTYAASAPGPSVEQLSWFIDDSVARDLQSIHGVGEVNRFGGVDREIRVSLDPEKLLALGVTAATVNEQVRADNVDLGGGRGELSGQEQAIRTLAGANRLDELKALPVALPGGRRVRLDELATVTDDAAEARTFTRLFDQPIVAFSIARGKGASDVTVDGLAAAKLAQIQAARDAGQDVTADMYPYIAGETALASSLPPWVAEGGMEKLLQRLHDPAIRVKIKLDMAADHQGWENLFFDTGGGTGVMVAGVENPELKKFDGKTIAQIAEAQKKSQLDTLFDFILALDLNTTRRQFPARRAKV